MINNNLEKKINSGLILPRLHIKKSKWYQLGYEMAEKARSEGRITRYPIGFDPDDKTEYMVRLIDKDYY
ncbi:hypothetical protein J4418_03185 [Candidatus Woesearchaeota archaeon]|nr:hypothetical protein [Candidatus Woesearchaeota archaeon]